MAERFEAGSSPDISFSKGKITTPDGTTYKIGDYVTIKAGGITETGEIESFEWEGTRFWDWIKLNGMKYGRSNSYIGIIGGDMNPAWPNKVYSDFEIRRAPKP